MKKLFILQVFITLSLHGMEERIAVFDEAIILNSREDIPHGGPKNLSLFPDLRNDVKMQECAVCSQEALIQCEKCTLTSYCSQEHQTLDWERHKDLCKEIKEADRGEIEQMRNMFAAYIRLAGSTKNKEYIRKGLVWHERAMIRIYQDRVCLKLTPQKEPVERVRRYHGGVLNHLVRQNICSAEEIQDIQRQISSEAGEWVKKKTESGELPTAHFIWTYCDFSPFSNIHDFLTGFFYEDEWDARRMGVVQAYIRGPQK